MQAIAVQFNLSETTCVLPSEVATARVRIFAPSFEMPFAGHPMLGTAHVVSKLGSGTEEMDLTLHLSEQIRKRLNEYPRVLAEVVEVLGA
jgi:PhzF family phenazine biosynthesis protein